MSDLVTRLLPLLLENRQLNNKGIDMLQKAHQQISRKADADRTAEECFVAGYYAEQIQQHDDALGHYTQAILKNPEFEAAYKFRAGVCIDTRQFDDALYDLDKALELDPEYTDARLEKARLFYESDENEKAVAELESLVKKQPDHGDAWALLGSTLEKAGDYAKATESFDKAIALNPDNGHFYTQRGLAHYFAGNLDPARADLEKVQRLTGVNHITQFNLALVLAETEDSVKDAFRNFERAFKRAPDMLMQFTKQAGETEKKRLMGKLQGIVNKLSAGGDTSGGQFYRTQLVQLLERKLNEAEASSESTA